MPNLLFRYNVLLNYTAYFASQMKKRRHQFQKINHGTDVNLIGCYVGQIPGLSKEAFVWQCRCRQHACWQRDTFQRTVYRDVAAKLCSAGDKSVLFFFCGVAATPFCLVRGETWCAADRRQISLPRQDSRTCTKFTKVRYDFG